MKLEIVCDNPVCLVRQGQLEGLWSFLEALYEKKEAK